MRFIVVLLMAAACFGQSKQNVLQTGLVDAHGANWIPPTSTFASPPSSPATGSVYIFTDASAAGACSAGGSALATCRWSGSAWSALGGGGTGTPPYTVSSFAVTAGVLATITHNLGTKDVFVSLRDHTSGEGVVVDWTATTSTITFTPTVAGTLDGVISTGGTGPQGPTVYPGAGVPSSTGSAWGASYTVGASASNLVQLNGSGQLPAVSGALLTNLPGGIAPYSCAVSGVSSIACTHNLGTSRPWVACYDGSGNLLGSTGASASVTSVVATSASVATLTFSGTTTATCLISTGSMGSAGSNGADGTNGSNGAAATIAVGTVTTGAAGSSAVITNSGTSSAAIFNFTISKGDTGQAGTGTGDASTNTSTSVDAEITLFSGTNGKLLKRATGTGYVKVASGVMGTPGAIPIADLPASVRAESKCFAFGADNASADLVDADIGPQGSVFMVPVIGTVIEITVAANAGTPNVIVQKNHAGTATDLVSAALATGSAGAVACAATGSACLDGTTKSGTASIVTAGSANVLAAGDWIQTKTGSGFTSSGAKRLSVCVTYSR